MLEARIDRLFAVAHAACGDDDLAAEATRRVLVADPHGPIDTLTARAALLAAGRADHSVDDAIVLARVLGWNTDRIAAQLHTTPQDVRRRIAHGLRTRLPPPGFATAASPARGAHAS